MSFLRVSGETTELESVIPFAAAIPPGTVASLRILLGCLRQHDGGHTFAHSIAVAVYAGHCARLLGLSPGAVQEVTASGLLHDIGKIAIDARLLLKPSRLEPTERMSVQLHPAHGDRLLGRLPGLSAISS